MLLYISVCLRTRQDISYSFIYEVQKLETVDRDRNRGTSQTEDRGTPKLGTGTGTVELRKLKTVELRNCGTPKLWYSETMDRDRGTPKLLRNWGTVELLNYGLL